MSYFHKNHILQDLCCVYILAIDGLATGVLLPLFALAETKQNKTISKKPKILVLDLMRSLNTLVGGAHIT